METLNWELFNITDLFEIKSGNRITQEDRGEPLFPYVGSSSINNGITDMCYTWNFENIISINSNGSVGYAFWHPYKIMLSGDCRALVPKFEITNNIGVFISTVLTKSYINNYNYGKKLTTTRLQQESIYLPAKGNDPDWEYIDQYMESIKPVFNE